MEELTFYIVIAMIILFMSIIGTFVLFLAYSGLFHRVEVGAGQPPVKDVVLAYHFGRGPYRNCGYYFAEISALAPQCECMGIYYDDPQQVEAEKLRWAVGCAVAKDHKKPDPELVKTLEEKGYKLITLPHVTSVVRTKFPHTTFLSFFLGIYKVYPALANYIKENKLCAHPYIEIYDGGVIHFVVPLARQSEFYVPECEEEEEEESDGVRADLSSDEGTPEKSKDEEVVQQQPSGGLPSKMLASSSVSDAVLRDSFDRETPVAASAKPDKKESALPVKATQPSASNPSSQPGSPTGKTGAEGESSSEVDSESYEVVKTEDIAEQS